jgi:hypothetical protein
MSGSAKGRVILPRVRRGAQVKARCMGVCAWCGWETTSPKVAGLVCLRCESDEIDWVPAAGRITPTRDEQFAHGSIALGLLGGAIHVRR